MGRDMIGKYYDYLPLANIIYLEERPYNDI